MTKNQYSQWELGSGVGKGMNRRIREQNKVHVNKVCKLNNDVLCVPTRLLLAKQILQAKCCASIDHSFVYLSNRDKNRSNSHKSSLCLFLSFCLFLFSYSILYPFFFHCAISRFNDRLPILLVTIVYSLVDTFSLQQNQVYTAVIPHISTPNQPKRSQM